MATWSQFGLQDAYSPVMEEFLFFHDFTNMILVFILTFVAGMMATMLSNKIIHKSLLEGQLLECVWTLVPALILIQIALPSLILLYMLDDASACSLTLKAVGHQWYWSYEYSDFWDEKLQTPIEFDSYMLPQEELASGMARLLEVDNRTPMPFNVHARVLISSADVLHSWAVPSLGVKADANPGRLNQAKFISYRPGLAFGQCSEICGANHSFMPIAIEFISASDFLLWSAAAGSE